jgi:hypothetical protein
MTQRMSLSDAQRRTGPAGEPPPPDVASFIRFCHHRRGVGWPELYDEMCGVAARREFHGWDHAALESRGLTFSLFEMPRLAGWVRAVIDGVGEERSTAGQRAATTEGRHTESAVA